jgi:hypothetical protein
MIVEGTVKDFLMCGHRFGRKNDGGPEEEGDRMANPELPLITKTYDLALWACHHVSRFPRSQRFLLGQRIESRLYDLLETLLKARYTRQRQPLLHQANMSVEILRYQMRMAHDLQCLRVNSYGFATRALHEIGSMIGGCAGTFAVAISSNTDDTDLTDDHGSEIRDNRFDPCYPCSEE